MYLTHNATEHSYRSALLQLVKKSTSLQLINEPKRIECGAPDLTISKNDIPVAYIETKPIGDGDLDGRKKNKEQFDRYKTSLDTIVFTDYLDFYLYKEGALILKLELATFDNKGRIVLNEDAVGKFESLMEHIRFAAPQTISSPGKLAKWMAAKAKLIADAILKVLANDTFQTGSFWNKLRAFKEVLNNDLNEKTFADLYAQTIAYGLFAARLHDDTPENFTRQEAANLIPRSNPFLRQIFQQLAGYDINDSIAWIVDDLVNIFAVTDVKKLRKKFGKEMEKRDPMIHFYEDFLSEYDPASKKKFGVYYTPQPVVEFIVRAVDDILKKEFNLPDGLADKSKVEVPIKRMEEGKDVETITMESRHRVQILDPATGTGTFLAEVVRRIKEQQQSGIWPKYVDEHLLPRIHGFELMMAPYTIAHLKLDMLINWWGDQKLEKDHDDRVQIYLTNSLSQIALANKYLLAEMIAREANEANDIKHNSPVMVMIGNPPYSVSSSNKGKNFTWIESLLKDYKKDLNEKKINLDDDYIKFIRLGQYYIERTGEGILAYITNNSFIDGVTHRQMRRELLRCFDDIYILDLHGNTRKNETAPDGSKDENVFSIMQGVSINIFIKKKDNIDRPAIVHHYDLYGSRKEKYAFLTDNSLSSVKWQIVQTLEPNLFFVPKDYSAEGEYRKGFKVDELMPLYSNGSISGNDELCISFSMDEARKKIDDFLNFPEEIWRIKNGKLKDARDWTYNTAKNDALKNTIKYTNITYRPLDNRVTPYTGTSRGLHESPQYKVLRHMINGNNICLIASRQFGGHKHFIIFSSENIVEKSSQPFAPYNVFPLYLYPSESELGFETERKPNLDDTIWHTIENWVKYGQAYKPQTQTEKSGLLDFNNEQTDPHFLTPEDIFDYIYGVLHSPLYREKYKEFLKVDFPRIPYPKNADEFEHYKECGHKLRELHLMHNVPKSKVFFEGNGDFEVNKVHWENERVYINDTQYFSNVPTEAWNMYIGGYQPAQKWLKDRKDRVLTYDDITHYEQIIQVLMETARIMKSIDDPTAQLEEYKRKVHDLEKQLAAQQHNDIHYHIDHVDTLNLGDNVENKFS